MIKKLRLVKRNVIGKSEIKEVIKVMKSGNLSNFLGTSGKGFLGGEKVLNFENKIQKYFNVKYAVTVNSWTSGLICAVGSIDNLQAGDEIILSPWTMSACLSSILFWNAIPVFADIEKDYFTICPDSIEKKITKKTRAIMAIDIFGQSANLKKIVKIAKKYNLQIISDTAQAMGSKYFGKYSGTFADIGGYSLNYHKHIHTGEGGIVVTNNKVLAERIRLIRNHAESVSKRTHYKNFSFNKIGFNFRLGEIESAIGIEQLKKLKWIVNKNQLAAKILDKGLSNLKGLQIPQIRDGATHVYYVYPLLIDQKECGFTKYKLFRFLKSHNIPVSLKYVNLHLLPILKEKNKEKNSLPWKLVKKKYFYKKNDCPIAEDYQNNKYLALNMCSYNYTKSNLNYIIKMFKIFWKKNERYI